jgi:N-acyl-D-aspartate/D-glutamate deacylase
MLDVLIKNAEIVDGSGDPARRGDVGIRDGRITLDTEKESASRTIDADGLVVAPGFVDLHTHYDPQVLWDGSASPSTLHGFTTVFGGNCGFSIAPLRPDTADYHKRMMAVVEGMPVESLLSGPAWDWSSFGDWLDRIEDGLAINAGFLVGHSALRLAVMGKNSIGAQASEQEIRDMQALLATSLEAGGIGFSSTQKTVHVDHNGDFVPSYHATREELLALSEVLSRYPGTNLGYASNEIARYKYPTNDIELMTAMSQRAGRPVNWNTVRVVIDDPEFTEEQLKAYDYSAEHDACIIGLVNPKPFKIWVGFKSGMAFSGLKRWGEVWGLPKEERKRALGDPAVRDQLRKEIASADLRLSQRTLVNWAGYEVAEGFGPEAQKLRGRNVGELARERNADPFDVLLDIMIADDLETQWAVREPNDSAEAWRKRAEVWLDSRTVLGGSDAGAHINSMVGATYSTVLLGEQVRERRLLPLEEAVRQLTDVPARLYGLQQRGRIAQGWHADLVVFDPRSVGSGPEKMRSDMPGGGRRLYSEAFGI